MDAIYLMSISAKNVDPTSCISLKGYNILPQGHDIAGYETHAPCAYRGARVKGHGTTHTRDAHARNGFYR